MSEQFKGILLEDQPFLSRMWQAWLAWRNVIMYRDLALACYIEGSKEQALAHLAAAKWWYHLQERLRTRRRARD